MSVFLLLSLFCCDIRNKCMVLFLMTYIWHFDVANKDVFTRSTTSNWRQTLKCVLETDGWKKNERKFERKETLSDLFNSDTFCIVTSFSVIHVVFYMVCDTGCMFTWKSVYSIRINAIMCIYCYCSTNSFCWIFLVC